MYNFSPTGLLEELDQILDKLEEYDDCPSGVIELGYLFREEIIDSLQIDADE